MAAIFERITREESEVGELKADDAVEAARAFNSALMHFFHPILIQCRIPNGEDTETGSRDQVRFLGLPGKAATPWDVHDSSHLRGSRRCRHVRMWTCWRVDACTATGWTGVVEIF